MIIAIVEMKLTLEIHLVMRIKDKSNCRDKVSARKICVLKIRAGDEANMR